MSSASPSLPPSLSREDLRELLRERPGPCVSIFLPTERAGRETRQNPVRFENLLDEAEALLAERGAGAALLAPARERLGDWDFWQHQDEGLALFAAPDGTTFHRLPVRPEPQVHVGGRFHTKPLYPLVEATGHFYVLALSGKQVRLLRVDGGPEPVEPEGMPRSLEEALRYDDPEKQLQAHTLGGAAAGAAGSVLYHGQGAAGDQTRAKTDLLRFCQQIDRALHPRLASERPLLVLASVEELWPLYREANTSARLLERGIPGNPEALSDEELAGRARPLVEPHLSGRGEALDAYGRLAHTPRASSRPEVVVPAAAQGRVAQLLVAREAAVWGRLDEERGEVDPAESPGPDVDELTDRAAADTWRHGGEVFVLPAGQMPDGASLAAVFRY